ncbi:MAG: ankyrin repeat domain-containing protein [Planctomycetota bacterium]|nr:ankyrin repeat domain-containing protein [Planctomycetota bacterium]
MDNLHDLLLGGFETHSVEEIREALDKGLDASQPTREKRPVDWLTEMYTRSDRFEACLRLLLDRGATIEDPLLEMVLLNDGARLEAVLRENPSRLDHRVTMVSAFTPLDGASLLHVASEYGHLSVARVLINLGADVNATAAVDANGLNGQTPIFHTVNSNANRALPIMKLLLQAEARLDIRLAGLTWGRGFEWETTLFDLTPISYAQFGLLPQMHRSESDIDANVRTLLEASNRAVPPLENVPNKYVARG